MNPLFLLAIAGAGVWLISSQGGSNILRRVFGSGKLPDPDRKIDGTLSGPPPILLLHPSPETKPGFTLPTDDLSRAPATSYDAHVVAWLAHQAAAMEVQPPDIMPGINYGAYKKAGENY